MWGCTALQRLLTLGNSMSSLKRVRVTRGFGPSKDEVATGAASEHMHAQWKSTHNRDHGRAIFDCWVSRLTENP